MDMRVAAYGVITDDQQRVLLARWSQGRRPAWTMPGGGLEPGEDPEVAARREVREETGYTVKTTQLLGIHSRVIPGRERLSESREPLHTLRIVYRAHVVRGKLRFETDGSTDMAGWYTLDQIAGMQRVRLVDIALSMAGLEIPEVPTRGR